MVPRFTSNREKPVYTRLPTTHYMVPHTHIFSPGLSWRVLVVRSRGRRGFFGQVDLSFPFPNSSHSLDLFSSRNFTPRLSIFACNAVAILHIYCLFLSQKFKSCALKFEKTFNTRPLDEEAKKKKNGYSAWVRRHFNFLCENCTLYAI